MATARQGRTELMEDVKKRKLDESALDGGASSTVDELRSMLEPIAKPQLVNLLAKLGTRYPSVAEEIRAISTSDPIYRKLFVRGLAWNTTSETLYAGRLAVCNLACEGLTGSAGTPDLAQRKIFIAGLSPEITNEMLLNYFATHGEIEEGSVAYDKDTDLSRGFGFVTYKTAEAAKKAIDDPEKTLGGRSLLVKYADSHPRGKTSGLPTHGMSSGIGYFHQQGGNVYPGIEMVPSVSVYPPYLQPPMMNPYPVGTYPSPPGTSQLGFATKKMQFGVLPFPSMGISGSYYVHKQ